MSICLDRVLKWVWRGYVCGFGWNLTGSGDVPVTRTSEHRNNIRSFIKGEEFFIWLNKCTFHNDHSPLWRWPAVILWYSSSTCRNSDTVYLPEREFADLIHWIFYILFSFPSKCIFCPSPSLLYLMNYGNVCRKAELAQSTRVVGGVIILATSFPNTLSPLLLTCSCYKWGIIASQSQSRSCACHQDT